MEFVPALYIIFAVVIAWTLWWKGYALWLAARRGDTRWFVVILIINTLGILELVYIFHVTKHTWKDIGLEFRKEVSKQ